MTNPGSEAADTPQAPAQTQSGERVVATNIGGKIYQVASDDDYLNHVQGEFEPHMVKLFRSLVDEDDVVLDIGANIGCMSILFGDMARQVFSFEPSPSTFVFLDRNIRAADCRNVTPVNLGLGRDAGSFELTFAKSNRSGGFVSNLTSASTGHQIEKIEIARGDAYIDQQDVSRVDFIKIDVEGFEKNVIEGLADTISGDKPIVTLELNHWCLNAFQRTSVPDFFDFLRGVFPYLYAVDVDDARNLHNNDDAYHVMYYHIVGGLKYANIVGAFDREQLAGFAKTYNLILN